MKPYFARFFQHRVCFDTPADQGAATPAAAPAAVIDYDALARAFVAAQAPAAAPTPAPAATREAPALVPTTVTPAAGGDGAVRDAGDIVLRISVPEAQRAGLIRVGNDRSIDGDGVFRETFHLLRAVGQRDVDALRESQHRLARAGHFGAALQQQAMGQERAVMLTSAEGLPFLPTTVLARIEDVMKVVGVARRVCTVINNLIGTTKIPNVSGRPVVFATNEASIIKSRKANFSSVSLDPKKWGVIVPWSNEMSEEAGAQVVAKIIQLVGEAFALAEDQVVFVADGTSTYHSKTGILADSGVAVYTLGAGDTGFDDITYADLILMRTKVAAGTRAQASYVAHPDMEDVFALMTDPSGQYVFGGGRGADGIDRIGGRAVYYTEAMPSLADTAAGTPFMTFGDYSFATIGFQRNLTAALLTEARIQDVDDSSFIDLAAQDSQALRFTAMWDVQRGLATPFARARTAAE